MFLYYRYVIYTWFFVMSVSPVAAQGTEFRLPWKAHQIEAYFKAIRRQVESGSGFQVRRTATPPQELSDLVLDETREAFAEVLAAIGPGGSALQLRGSHEDLLDTFAAAMLVVMNSDFEQGLSRQEGARYPTVVRALLAHEVGHVLFERLRDSNPKGSTPLKTEDVLLPLNCTDELYFMPSQPCYRYIRDHVAVDLAGIWILRRLGYPAADMSEGLRAILRWQRSTGQHPLREFELRIQALESLPGLR